MQKILSLLALLSFTLFLVAKPIQAGDKEKDLTKKEFLEVGDTGLNLKGNLQAPDPKNTFRPGCNSITYQVKLEKGKTYTIDMVSKEVDSYLILVSPDLKKVVAKDDDGGGFPDARIQIEITETAVYNLLATTFNQNENGNFTLTIREGQK